MTSTQQLYTLFYNSLNATADFMPFSAATSFTQKMEETFSSASTYLVAQRTILLPTDNRDFSVDPKKITDDDLRSYNASQADKLEFRRHFGAMFISGAVEGGILFLAIYATSTDKDKQSYVAAKLSATLNSGLDQATIKGELQEIVRSHENTVHVEARIVQVGGTAADQTHYVGVEIVKAIDYFNNFPTTIDKAPWRLFAILSAYDNILPQKLFQ